MDFDSTHRTTTHLYSGLRAIALILIALLLMSCGLFAEEETYRPPPEDDDRPWILVDLYHTRIQNHEDYWLHRDQYNYQGTYGFRRLFDHLNEYDYPSASIREHELSAPRLEGYDILFINLVHDSRNRPDFTDQEREVIKDFVYNGGGLFVIGDHSNVYRHAERVNPFLKPMGLEMMYHTIVDYPPYHSVSGLGWIMMHEFSDHPINDEIDMISFKTGGPIAVSDSADGLAFTSEASFADHWDEENERGFYGNWSQGDDHELEPSGPHAVAAASTYGDGRVVLVGDQNIFGDAWINLGNNFEFAVNIFDWLAKNEDAEIPLRHQARTGHNIAFESYINFYQTARAPDKGYYSMFIETNRNEEVTGRATTRVETRNTDTMYFVSSDLQLGEEDLDDRSYTDDDLDTVADYLHGGGQVVISFEPNDIRGPSLQLLNSLAEDFEIEFGEELWTLNEEEIPQSTQIDGFHPIESSHFDVDGKKLGTLYQGEFPSDSDYRDLAEDYVEADFDAYLHDVRSSWGEPLVEAIGPDDEPITIARRKVVGNGELIIFIQDGFFRNGTLSNEELLRPTSFFRKDTIEFYHRFLDYLGEHYRAEN